MNTYLISLFGITTSKQVTCVRCDGAPFGKDDSALAWLVSFLNCGHRISSRNENFLLGANCSEDCEAIRRYVLKATCKTWNGESRNGMGNGMERGMESPGIVTAGICKTRNCKSRNL